MSLVALPAVGLLGLALAMDAFAVALTQGARYRPPVRRRLLLAGAFGAAQGLMPLVGFFAGALVLAYVASVDHWIAFVLLGYLGIRMLRDGGEIGDRPQLAGWALLSAALATSIDALAAGLTLPTLSFPPLASCALIALITFFVSGAGTEIGRSVGERLGRPAEVLGGIILIGLGVRIVLEHTGVL